ncbi:hypothetical protein K1719_032204 [Acacia pycnantha]|nr:hypothetical protein K1719_032204 [Acacia pycnantha]
MAISTNGAGTRTALLSLPLHKRPLPFAVSRRRGIHFFHCSIPLSSLRIPSRDLRFLFKLSSRFSALSSAETYFFCAKRDD